MSPSDDELLDGTVPEEYRNISQIVKAVAEVTDSSGAIKSSATENVQITEVSMDKSTVNTPAPTIDAAQIAEIARGEASKLLKAEDNVQAIAKVITELKTNEATANAAVASAKAELATASTKLADSEKTITELRAEVDTAKASITTLTNEKAELSKASENLKTELAKLEKEILDSKATATIASRTETLTTNKLNTEKRLAKAIARTTDGKFEMSDEAFKAYVEDLSEVAKASASTTTTEAAPPAATESKNDEKPAAATASTQTAASPSEPDLTDVQNYSHSMASMLSGNVNIDNNGVNEYAKMFGTELTN